MLHASRSYGFSSNFFSAFFTFSGIYSAAACKTTQMAQDNGVTPRSKLGGCCEMRVVTNLEPAVSGGSHYVEIQVLVVKLARTHAHTHSCSMAAKQNIAATSA